MTAPARLSLAAPPGHALAEGVRLAFAVRGTLPDLVALQAEGPPTCDGPFRLTLRRGADVPVILHDPAAMLELSEDLHPDDPLHPRDPLLRAAHREGISHLPRMARLLDRLVRCTDPRDVDINIHFLRDRIDRIATILVGKPDPQGAFSLLDLASFPLFWRIGALDRCLQTHLLTGHESLHHWLDRLGRHPLVAGVLDPPLPDAWVQGVAALGGTIAATDGSPDWSTAFGACAGSVPEENDLPYLTQRTKVHSIGGNARIR